MKSIKITKSITRRESPSFIKYLSDISSIPTFKSGEDENKCAVKAFNGDDKAKKELISRNLRFVVSVAKQYRVKGMKLEDLVNVGNIGITTAAGRFDPTKGFKFISYAVWYIRKEIQDFLNNNARVIRLPLNRITEVTKYKTKLDKLEMKLMRAVDINDMLDEYDEYSREDIIRLTDMADSSVASLDMSIGEDNATLGELVSDSSMMRTDELVIQSDRKASIERLFSILRPFEKEILTKLFGLDGKVPCTLSDVGDYYELSRESIRQNRDKALKKIKNHSNVDIKNYL